MAARSNLPESLLFVNNILIKFKKMDQQPASFLSELD